MGRSQPGLLGHLHDLVPARGAGRRLGSITLVQAVGTGIFLTSGAVLLTSTVGIAPQQVGLGLGAAGAFGMLASVPAGRIADRIGPRLPLAFTHLAAAVLFACYATVDSFPGFLVVACGIAATEGAGEPLRAAMVYAMADSHDATVLRSQIRSLLNAGLLAGAGLASVALAIGTRGAFVAVMLVNAAAQLACAALVTRLPPALGPARERARTRSGRHFRDARFLLLTLVNGGLEVHLIVVTVGVPLWLVTRLTAVPTSVNALLLVINTVLVVSLQVPIGRRAATIGQAAALQSRAGVALAVGCVVLAGSSLPDSVVLTVATLVAAAAVLAMGELYQSASAFTVSFELPPPGRQGEYQGVFGARKGLRQIAGPVLLSWLVVDMGAAGWLLLAALFVVLGGLGHVLVRGARTPDPQSR